MADMDKHDRIVWIDLEMTGLDIHEHTIVEVAALITDADLNVLGEGVDVVVHASEEELGRRTCTSRRDYWRRFESRQ